MDIQTFTRVANATLAVSSIAMVGIILYSERMQKKIDRTTAEIDEQLARGEHLMKNWNRMPTFD